MKEKRESQEKERERKRKREKEDIENTERRNTVVEYTPFFSLEAGHHFSEHESNVFKVYQKLTRKYQPCWKTKNIC